MRGKFVLAAASLGLALLAGGPAAAAQAGPQPPGTPGQARPAVPSSWETQLARPTAVACARGQTPVLPTRGWTDALGVSHFTYRSVPGLVSSIPPRGLTASKVTPAMLADLGMPGHAALRSRAVRSLVLLAEHPAAEAFCRGRRPIAQPARAIAAGGRPSRTGLATRMYSENWGGYEVTEAENDHTGINYVQAAWNNGRSSTTSAPSAEFTWIGIGGGGGEGNLKGPWGLIQAGSSMETDQGYQSWLEFLGGPDFSTNQITCNKKVEPGCGALSTPVDSAEPQDSMSAQVYWSTSTTGCFIVTDQQRSSADISACYSDMDIPYDHTSAEWIVEKVSSPKYFDDPGTISWYDQDFADIAVSMPVLVDPFSGSFEADILYDTAVNSNPTATGCGSGTGIVAVPYDGANQSSNTDICRITGYDSP